MVINRNVKKLILFKRLIRVNIIAAITSEGRYYFTVSVGINNSSTFDYFLLNLVKHLFEWDVNFRDKVVFVLDNARTHRSNQTTALMESLGIDVLFLGPYSYQMAPVEKFFQMLKAKKITKVPRVQTNK